MFDSLLRATIGHSRIRSVEFSATPYRNETDRERIEGVQVARFNDVWTYARQNLRFYHWWAEEHNIPDRIDSINELREFPRLTKATLVSRASEVFTDDRGRTIPLAYSTGGSTGTPTRYPRGKNEGIRFYANTYTGRSWWGIQPFDSYVHVWGHAHLFGGSRLSRMKRSMLDRLANATRVNAYDMSAAALVSHTNTILRRNPRYVVGYTSALCKIARHIEKNQLDVSGLTNLRAIVVTAETVTPADVRLIEQAFRVPVVIEYGAAETGVIATSRNGSWPLQVLWKSFIVTVRDDSDLAVTTLDDRIFPLINYSIGDAAIGGDIREGNALTLAAVLGRSKESVIVSTETGEALELSAILPVHILKGFEGVDAVQYRQESARRLTIFIAFSRDISLDSIASKFIATLRTDHPSFDPTSVVFKEITEPILTAAGKQSLFI